MLAIGVAGAYSARSAVGLIGLVAVAGSLWALARRAQQRVALAPLDPPPTRDEQLEELRRLEAIGQLAGGVAHDFNNILTVIGIHSEFLLAGLDPLEPHHNDAHEIHEAVTRASMLTKQLLAFSRRQGVEMTPVSLNDVVRDMAPMLRRLIGEDIVVRTFLDPAVGIVLSDAGQMQQVIMNLAVNARDAMPHGGTITITTSEVELDDSYVFAHGAVTPGNYVMLAVSDTGCGMPEHVRARIFEPFFTTKPAGVGTGLGLATVLGIVRQSGGHIWVYSEPGEGSAFKIYLPLSAGQVSKVPGFEEPLGARGAEMILLVEDEPNVCEATRRILTEHGYDVVEAASGPEALAVADRLDRGLSLLLTDVVLPEAPGPWLVERIAARHPGARVLYMSGYTDADVERRGLGSGANMLQKPFSSRALLRAVRKALDASAPLPSPRHAARIAS